MKMNRSMRIHHSPQRMGFCFIGFVASWYMLEYDRMFRFDCFITGSGHGGYDGKSVEIVNLLYSGFDIPYS